MILTNGTPQSSAFSEINLESHNWEKNYWCCDVKITRQTALITHSKNWIGNTTNCLRSSAFNLEMR